MLWGHFAKETHYLRSLQDNMKDNVDTTGCFQPGDDTKQTWNKVVANSKVINMWVLLIKLNWIKQSLKWDWSCVTSAKHSASCLHLLLVGEEASSLHQLVDPPN